MIIKNSFKLVIVMVIFFTNQSYASAAQVAVKKPIYSLDDFKQSVRDFFQDMFGTKYNMDRPLTNKAESTVLVYEGLSENDKKKADACLELALSEYVNQHQNEQYNRAKDIKFFKKELKDHLKSFFKIKGFQDEAIISRNDWMEKFKTDQQKKEEEQVMLSHIPGTPQYIARMELSMNQEAQNLKKTLDGMLQAVPNFMNNSEYKKTPTHKLLIDSLQKQINKLNDTVVKFSAMLTSEPQNVKAQVFGGSATAAQPASSQSASVHD